MPGMNVEQGYLTNGNVDRIRDQVDRVFIMLGLTLPLRELNQCY